MEEITIDKIHIEGGTQVRYQLDWFAISEYAQAMQEGAIFPPIVVFQNGEDGYWLADGFHRVQAALKLERSQLAADVRKGGKSDAILYAVGANQEYGIRLTKKDKENAVKIMLKNEVLFKLSDHEIARRCGVAHSFVWTLREEIASSLEEQIEKPTMRKAKRKGKEYLIDTTNIGKKKEPKPKPQLDLLDEQVPPEPELLQSANIMVHNADSRHLLSFNVAPVHLVITSPPYNVGIDYGARQDELIAYLELITEIWRECYKVMVDGARIAVVVPFGVGRNPWMPMAAKIAETLISAGFTWRGQIVWDKSTTGNRTTWGSFRLPTNPSLRDTTEAIVIAHKNSPQLEIPKEHHLQDDKGSYSPWLACSDYFMELAQDHWTVAPESAQRIGHPAPFPVELVKRLMHFYGYPGMHVLDPFAGSGTVGVAAKKLGCDATLFEINEAYCNAAKERIYG